MPVDHHGWHRTSLTKFRARLLLHKKEWLALENTLRLAAELGMLDGPLEQIVDSTPMLGAPATQDTVRLVRFGVRKLIDAVTAVDADAGNALTAGLAFDYARPGEKPDCQWRIKAERERMLTRVAQDAQRALLAVEQAEGCWMTSRSRRRMSCWQIWSARTSMSIPTAFPACTAAPSQVGSSRRSTPRCATAASAPNRGLTATSCPPRSATAQSR